MKLFFCFSMIIFSFVFSFGQEKSISEQEFKYIFENWRQFSKRQTYHIRTISEVRLNGKLSDRNDESESEYAPPDKRRFVSILKTPAFTSKFETIQIGNKQYTRKDEGLWKESIIIPPKSDPDPKKKTIIDSNQYFYFGQDTVREKRAKIFGQITKSRISYENSERESFSTSITKYWFDKKGFLLKMESEMEIVTGIMTSYTKRTYLYDYDPKIKIEAPTINNKSQ